MSAVAALGLGLLTLACSAGPADPTAQATLATAATGSADATASDTSGQPVPAPGQAPAGQPPAPPAEAIAACTSVADGAVCSFTGPRGEIDGICRALPGGQRACAPENGPPTGGSGSAGGPGSGPHGGPPPEALSACAGKAAGVSCAFDAPFGSVTGTCSLPPSGDGALACKPEGPPPQH